MDRGLVVLLLAVVTVALLGYLGAFVATGLPPDALFVSGIGLLFVCVAVTLAFFDDPQD